jgi:hypothetical protein
MTATAGQARGGFPEAVHGLPDQPQAKDCGSCDGGLFGERCSNFLPINYQWPIQGVRR